jgi:hypothetical protein
LRASGHIDLRIERSVEAGGTRGPAAPGGDCKALPGHAGFWQRLLLAWRLLRGRPVAYRAMVVDGVLKTPEPSRLCRCVVIRTGKWSAHIDT